MADDLKARRKQAQDEAREGQRLAQENATKKAREAAKGPAATLADVQISATGTVTNPGDKDTPTVAPASTGNATVTESPSAEVGGVTGLAGGRGTRTTR